MGAAPSPQGGEGIQGPCHHSPHPPSAAPVSQSLAHNHLFIQPEVEALTEVCHLFGASFALASHEACIK